jgi:hypothetical protein
VALTRRKQALAKREADLAAQAKDVEVLRGVREKLREDPLAAMRALADAAGVDFEKDVWERAVRFRVEGGAKPAKDEVAELRARIEAKERSDAERMQRAEAEAYTAAVRQAAFAKADAIMADPSLAATIPRDIPVQDVATMIQEAASHGWYYDDARQQRAIETEDDLVAAVQSRIRWDRAELERRARAFGLIPAAKDLTSTQEGGSATGTASAAPTTTAKPGAAPAITPKAATVPQSSTGERSDAPRKFPGARKHLEEVMARRFGG